MSVKVFFFIFFLTAQTIVFAKPTYEKDSFVFEILKKDIKVQQNIIEKRVTLALVKSIKLNLKPTLSYYFDPKTKFENREKFIDQILSSQEINDINKARFLNSCDVFQCNLWAAEKINKDNFNLLKTSVYKLFRPENLEFIIAEKTKMKLVLEKIMTYAAKADDEGNILFFSRYYGFYPIGLNYFKNNPSEIAKTLWSQIDYCVLLFLDQKMDEANNCLSKRDEPIFKLHKMSLQSISSEHGKPDRKQFEKVKKEMFAFKDKDTNMLITVFELFIFKDESEINFSKLSPKDFGGHYFFGFMIQKIMQKMKKKPDSWLQQVESTYNKTFQDYFLSKVLKGDEPPKQIVEHFGPNAPISRAINFSN